MRGLDREMERRRAARGRLAPVEDHGKRQLSAEKKQRTSVLPSGALTGRPSLVASLCSPGANAMATIGAATQ